MTTSKFKPLEKSMTLLMKDGNLTLMFASLLLILINFNKHAMFYKMNLKILNLLK